MPSAFSWRVASGCADATSSSTRGLRKAAFSSQRARTPATASPEAPATRSRCRLRSSYRQNASKTRTTTWADGSHDASPTLTNNARTSDSQSRAPAGTSRAELRPTAACAPVAAGGHLEASSAEAGPDSSTRMAAATGSIRISRRWPPCVPPGAEARPHGSTIARPCSGDSHIGLHPPVPSDADRLLEPAEDVQEHGVHLADRAVRLHARHQPRHHVLRPRRRSLELVERCPDGGAVAAPLHLAQAGQLPLADAGIRLEQRELRLLLLREAVDAHYDLLPGFEAPLLPVGLLRDLPLDGAALDGSNHAAQAVDPLDQRRDLRLHPVGEGLDVPGAPERIGDRGHAGFVREDLLGAQRELRRLRRRQRERLVVGG